MRHLLFGRTVVVKYGGNAMSADASFAEDVACLHSQGVRCVVVHGGGPQISDELDRRRVPSEFRGGYRVTTPAAMRVVREVLVERVNPAVVAGLVAAGCPAVGVPGDAAGVLVAERRTTPIDGVQIDLGQVGRVTEVQLSPLLALLDGGRVPVVAGVAQGRDGQLYNVNADAAAAAVAVAVRAARLVVLTDVDGLYATWPQADRVVDSLTAAELERLLPSLSSGMIPKMQACLDASRGGVGRAHVVNASTRHALCRVLAGSGSLGTTVLGTAA